MPVIAAAPQTVLAEASDMNPAGIRKGECVIDGLRY